MYTNMASRRFMLLESFVYTMLVIVGKHKNHLDISVILL